jgi:hypothetical protein
MDVGVGYFDQVGRCKWGLSHEAFPVDAVRQM